MSVGEIIGWSALGLAVLLFFFLGWWADSTWDLAPWGRLAGVLIGAAGGMIKFIRTVTRSPFTDGLKKETRGSD